MSKPSVLGGGTPAQAVEAVLGPVLIRRLLNEVHVVFAVTFSEDLGEGYGRTVHRAGCTCGWLATEGYSFAGLGSSAMAHARRYGAPPFQPEPPVEPTEGATP